VQATAVYLRQATGCSMFPTGARTELYEVGEPVPATTFVGATPVVEALADGWSRVYLEGEDGSRWARSLRRGTVDCTVTTAADGVGRCLPAASGTFRETVFDADCMTPVALGARTSCPVTDAYLWSIKSDGCSRRNAVHRATRRLDTGYARGSNGCRPYWSPSSDVYALGEELPAGDFPVATLGNLDDPGRLKRQAISTSGGTYGLPAFWDSLRGERCTAFPAKDGTHRCAPGSLLVDTPVYADSRCTRAVSSVDACLFPIIGMRVPDLCPKRYRIFRVGAVTAVEHLHYLDSDGRCAPVPNPPSPSEVFRAVEEVTPGQLVELSRTP
jgi:hypothetical protein